MRRFAFSRALLGASVLAGLSGGCASQATRPPAAPAPPPSALGASADARQRLAAAETLCRQLAADPALAPLRGRMLAFDESTPWTRAMMIDGRYVDEDDRALLRVMDERRAVCRQALIAASPAQAVPLLDCWARQDAALLRLYDRRIPIGTFNQAMADAQAQLSIDLVNQRADTAARANRHIAEPPLQDAPRRGDEAAFSADSFRALGGRPARP